MALLQLANMGRDLNSLLSFGRALDLKVCFGVKQSYIISLNAISDIYCLPTYSAGFVLKSRHMLQQICMFYYILHWISLIRQQKLIYGSFLAFSKIGNCCGGNGFKP